VKERDIMKRLALPLGLAICTIAASTAYATTRSHAGSPPAQLNRSSNAVEQPLAQPGKVLIESEPGVYIVAPRSVPKTTSLESVRPSSPEPASSTDERPVVHPGEVLIESEPGVYIVAPRSVPETTS
jgi:hypothetical protein